MVEGLTVAEAEVFGHSTGVVRFQRKTGKAFGREGVEKEFGKGGKDGFSVCEMRKGRKGWNY